MEDDHLDKLLTLVESESIQFAVSAGRLSERLEEINARFSALPGKIHVSVESPHGELSFGRGDEGRWELWYRDNPNGPPQRIESLSVKLKVAASKMIDLLAEQLFAELKSVNNSIGGSGCEEGRAE